MARRKFRCPLCGKISSSLVLDQEYPIEVFIVRGLGKGRGFRFIYVSDPELVSKVIGKIKLLYARYIESLFYMVKERLRFPVKERISEPVVERIVMEVR